MYPFKQVITTEKQFRDIMGYPGQRVLDKSINYLDSYSYDFINKSPLLMLASFSKSGQVTVSPKGDPSGFVQIINKKQLLIPERLGNQRAETFKNILQNPNIGIIFIVPGKGETLRISGQAQIIRDDNLRMQFSINNKAPEFLIAVTVHEVYFHCGKAMKRSNIWAHEKWEDVSQLAKLGEIMVNTGQLKNSVKDMQKRIDDDERKRLY